ncbi:MAG: hypothetical protein ACUVWX_00965 [Kiritimatiellia bacterium]
MIDYRRAAIRACVFGGLCALLVLLPEAGWLRWVLGFIAGGWFLTAAYRFAMARRSITLRQFYGQGGTRKGSEKVRGQSGPNQSSERQVGINNAEGRQ